MKFINKGETQQVRQEVPINDVNGPSGFCWKKVKVGETIDLPKKVGQGYGFKKVSNGVQKLPKTTEGKIGNKKVETKQIKKKDNSKINYINYRRELGNIKGIGKSTINDIVIVFPTKEILIKAIKKKEKLPFRNDVGKKLRREYGK